MIKSMTGYGKAEAVLETGKLTIEIKTEKIPMRT